MRRLTLVLLPAFGLVGVILSVAVLAPRFLAAQHYPTTPGQPLYFDHRVHAEVAGLDCAFCHRTAEESATAGLPDVQQCMFCHVAVAPEQVARVDPRSRAAGVSDSERGLDRRSQADMAQLRQFWVDRRPVNWARVHLVPDHTRFPHDAHVQAGVPCATCHGDVGRMGQVVQVRSLKMGDCVACHQETGAPNQCGDCHY
jgi:hypothetical protein